MMFSDSVRRCCILRWFLVHLKVAAISFRQTRIVLTIPWKLRFINFRLHFFGSARYLRVFIWLRGEWLWYCGFGRLWSLCLSDINLLLSLINWLVHFFNTLHSLLFFTFKSGLQLLFNDFFLLIKITLFFWCGNKFNNFLFLRLFYRLTE